MKPVECSCDACKKMCEVSTCLPTPDEAISMMRRGLAHRMSLYKLAEGDAVGPSMAGYEGLVSCTTRLGRCTFYTDGKCELHESGKPLEGRLAHHDRDWLKVHFEVMRTWTPSGMRRVMAERMRLGNR